MTRRITWIILLTVWATLIAAGLTAYLTTRAQMLKHLHHAMLDELMNGREYPHAGKMYKTVGSKHLGDTQQTIAGPTRSDPHAELVRATWVYLPGERNRKRSIVARVWARPQDGKGELVQLTVPYRREAYEFDPLMNRVGIALVIATLVGGVSAAILARLAAKTSLRPLRSTADVIGTIDDRSLDRRIDPTRLPPELVPMAEKLNGMLERLETASKQRKRFLADASHELRTPVAALMTALELATRKPRDLDTYRQTLETCLADARHLRRLVEALMSQVRGEAALEVDEWQQIDLGRLIDECVKIVRPLAEKRSIDITTDIDALPPIRTQPTRLRSVLLNLLANAAEYSDERGTIEVSAQTDGAWMEIRVSDNGPGIAPELMPHIFEPFFRGDETRQVSEHLGLGLFLVHSHARALGGDCRVQSRLGEGTRFTIRLPATEMPPAPVTPTVSQATRF